MGFADLVEGPKEQVEVVRARPVCQHLQRGGHGVGGRVAHRLPRIAQHGPDAVEKVAADAVKERGLRSGKLRKHEASREAAVAVLGARAEPLEAAVQLKVHEVVGGHGRRFGKVAEGFGRGREQQAVLARGDDVLQAVGKLHCLDLARAESKREREGVVTRGIEFKEGRMAL